MKCKISDICDINMENISSKEQLEFINYLDTSSIKEGVIDKLQRLEIGKDKVPSRAKRKVKMEDIIISTVRPNQKHYGILKNIEENMIVSTGFVVISTKKDKADSEYIYRFLTQERVTNYLQNIAETSTSAYPSIKPSVIEEIDINLPPLPEQKAIANILSTLDEKIETNRRINENLEKQAQALFKHWFLDFEFPNENGEPYKSSGGEMVESELGMIPKGWEVGTVSDYGEIIGGATPSKKVDEYYTCNGIPWITPKDLSGKSEVYVSRGSIDITEEGFDKSSVKIMPRGTVLFSSRAPIGYIAISKNEVTTNQGFKSIVPFIDKGYSSEYIYLWLSQNIEIIKNQASGSTFKEISGKEMKNLKAIIPSERILKIFSGLLNSLFIEVEIKESELKKIKAIRDTLLPKLMSGEIRVPLENENIEDTDTGEI